MVFLIWTWFYVLFCNSIHLWKLYTLLVETAFHNFSNPHPPLNVVQECVGRLKTEVICALKHKWPKQKLTLEFRHDAYSLWSNGKWKPAEKQGWMLFEENNFTRCQLPAYWFFLFNLHGDGFKVKFAVNINLFWRRTSRNFK